MNILSIVFAFVFCSTGILHAQDKPQLVPATFRDFSGGLVDSIDPLNLPANASPDSLNIEIDNPSGSIRPRKGIKTVGKLPSGNKATALFEYINQNGLKYFIATDNANIYATRDFVSWTTIKTGLSDANIPSFASVRSKLWIVTGSTWAMTWDGTTTTLLSGAGSTPSPPPLLCRYLEFWKELVWCARSNSYPSGVQFSQLDDTDGNDLDPSTGAVSWPATNVINVNQDAGNPIYGLKVYRDRLYVFKLDGIYQIFYENPVNISVAKISNNGAKYNSAIYELDSILYYVGIDGIYGFDGERSVRISDAIDNTFNSINQLDSSEGIKFWDSKTDWDLGTFSNTNSSGTPGSVELSSVPLTVSNGDFESGILSPHSAYESGGFAGIASSSPINGTYSGYAYFSQDWQCSSKIMYVYNNSGTTVTTMGMYQFAGYPTALGTTTVDTSAYLGQTITLHFKGDSCGADGVHKFDLWIGTFVAGRTLDIAAYPTVEGWYRIDNIRITGFISTGTYTSDVFDAVSVSTWASFNATFKNNGGELDFSYRTGKDLVDISTTVWSTITIGGFISAPSSDRYFQFIASFTASTSSKETPELEDASIGYFQGSGNTNPIYLYPIRNRLWISNSVGDSTTNNNVLVKSKYPSNSFNKYDLQISPMIRYSGNYYAGASTHSAIQLIDVGTDDDGRAINWYWTSRDEAWSDPWVSKLLYEISTDFRKGSASNVQIGYSLDGGISFTNKSVNMYGSGRETDRRYFSSPKGQAIRLRVGDSVVGESATILGVTGWAYPEKMRR